MLQRQHDADLLASIQVRLTRVLERIFVPLLVLQLYIYTHTYDITMATDYTLSR